MKITIHRGTGQIGGCVTEYENNGWRLFVDYGEQLPGAPTHDEPLEIEGLTKGDVSKSALLLTHYHGDHIGRIPDLPKTLPIYMGRIARDIQVYASEHLSCVNKSHARIAERLKQAIVFNPGEQFTFGDFNIMPINLDHSAFDAYAFRIEADGLAVFHTGDFRTHGFRSGKLSILIQKYIGKVDYVVCEGTNVARQATNQPEYELQKDFEQAFKENKYNIVYLSSTNIDRLFGIYKAAQKAGRPFYVDCYQKHIMDIVAQSNGLWSKARLYKYGTIEPTALFDSGNSFNINQKFIDYTTDRGYVLIARASQKFDDLIARLPGEHKQRYLSMWKGYVDEKCAAYDPDLARAVGNDYRYMHTSGHCDMQSLAELLELVSPCAVIPIHTDNPDAFAKLFCDRWPIIKLNDGESINPISSQYYDTTEVKIYAVKQPSDDIKEINNEHSLQWWSLDERSVGHFSNSICALFALQHTIYAPNRIVGYGVEWNLGYKPITYREYNPDFTLNAVYRYGGHAPMEPLYQEPCRFKAGDKALTIDFPNGIVMPCEVIGPVTKEKMTERDGSEFFSFGTLKEFLEHYPEPTMLTALWDWLWDSVIIRPLVNLECSGEVMKSEELVQRIYLFPYREFEV